MKPNVVVNVLMFIEEAIRCVMGLCLLVYPLIAISEMLPEPYCEIARNDKTILPVENPAHVLCDVLFFFVRAFGWFNFVYGLFLEIGRRQLSHAHNRTGWFIFVALLTHLCGLAFELLLKPTYALSHTNSAAVLWHSSYTILYSFCLFKFT